jgi:multidrug efflux system membrane fusion protein
MSGLSTRGRVWTAAIALTATAAGVAFLLAMPSTNAQSQAQKNGPPPAAPVSVAVVEQRDVALWDEFSGRLEAVERVEVRSRVAGAVQAAHFREGALVKKDDLLISIDPDPYAAEVERAEAQVVAARARVALTKSDLDRGTQLFDTRAVSQRDLDTRLNAHREAEANLKAALAALQSSRLNLRYTQVRAPVDGRVGKLEITVGNLVTAGPEAPILTTLVSVDPIYASFNADEQIVLRAINALGGNGSVTSNIGRIPVQISTVTSNGTPIKGRLQLIDNQVDIRTGTVRLRAVFDNPEGKLIPGQFVRLRMGQATPEPVLLVSERAIGTDQNKRFVMVVADDNKATYREVSLGSAMDGLRVVTSGLKPGERIIVNGLQRVRPGAPVAPETVPMDGKLALQSH